MKNKRFIVLSASVCLTFALFIGCGERSGEKEYNKALSAWENGDLVRARALFEKSIRKTSGNEKKSVALNQLGLILWELGETEAAVDVFSKSCNLTETLTGANLNMGIALFHAGRTDEAEVALNNVLGNNPKNQTAMAMLGLIEMKNRNWAGASEELSKTVSLNPRSPAGQNALALAELHQNTTSDTAVKRLQQVTSAYPDYTPAIYNLAVINDQWLSNERAAKRLYEQYIQKAGANGSHTEVAKKSVALLGTKKTSTTSQQTNPDAANRFMAEGAKFHSAKKYTDAVKTYQKAIQADPTQKNAFYNMGLAYYADGKYTDAAKACDSALRIDPRFSDARYMLSLSYFQLKKWSDAETAANALVQIDSKRGEEMLKYISNARKR
ncbi:MAG: tetratricopeptide repeat protein [Pontiella sp.]